MSLTIGSGVKLYSGLKIQSEEDAYTQIFFTIQNFVWKVMTPEAEIGSFQSQYDVSKLGSRGLIFYKDNNNYIVYQMTNRVQSTPFKHRQKTEIQRNLGGERLKRICLIDIDVKIYSDNSRQILVHNDNLGKTFYKQNNYYETIINNVLDTYYS